MKTPISIPQDPQQPSEAQYPLSALQIVKTYTPESYAAEFGAPPPPNPNVPYKSWFDSTRVDKPGATRYVVGYTSDGKSIFQTIPNAIAARVNFPSRFEYPEYVPDPTKAVYQLNGTYAGPVDPKDLCDWDTARAIAQELGAKGIEDATPMTGMYVFVPNGETRRELLIQFHDGSSEVAGQLLAEKNRWGVGAAVKVVGNNWELAVENAAVADGPAVPVPLRALLPNERISTSLVGISIVVRTDLRPTTSADFFDRYGKMIAEIHSAVVK